MYVCMYTNALITYIWYDKSDVYFIIQGFNLMGIWPPYSNGSDVNAVDVCMEKGLVVTANNEFGLTKLFNYPCVVKAGTCILYFVCMYVFM
jgi:hypothetical protein